MYRYRSIVCVCILLSAITGCGNRSAAGPNRDVKYGYVDKHGSLVVKPLFDEALSFSEGMAAVRVGQKWGYIDKQGRLIIKPTFCRVGQFHEGLALVVKKMSTEPNPVGEDYAFVDKRGREVFSPNGLCTDFSGGLAAFGVGPCESEYRWGYIDRTGKVVVNPHMGSSDSVSEGLVFFTRTDGSGKSGYMNESGRVVFETPWTVGGSFHEGRASFTNNAGKTGYIDRTGRIVIKPAFDDGGDFHCDRAVFRRGGVNSPEHHGYINKHGRVCIKPRFFDAKDFSEGLARFQDGKTFEWGFIDTEGNVRIKAQYDTANDFHEGLALVVVGNKSEYIDQRGHIRMSRPVWKDDGIEGNHLSFSQGLVPWPVKS